MAEPHGSPPGVLGPHTHQQLPQLQMHTRTFHQISVWPLKAHQCIFTPSRWTLNSGPSFRPKSDIETLIGRLEEKQHKEIQGVRKDVQSLSTRLTMGEFSMATLSQRVPALVSLQEAHVDAAVALQLHIEDMEDRSRGNNLQLRGLRTLWN